ncbi:MAG: DUF2007 domain-containing protein [Reichenbachiella sp.]|uniref:putative signal transducing protein n=1 Tax=Reichenbachiella sp. TaxID=2184521 RepID=UPI0032631676
MEGVKMEKEMKLALLTICDHSINANLIRTRLEHDGIPCFLFNEHFTNLMPTYYHMLGSGVRVMIPEERLDEAKQLLQISDGRITCPNCHSENVVNENESFFKKVVLLFIGIFMVSPIGNLINDFFCKDCGCAFKK